MATWQIILISSAVSVVLVALILALYVFFNSRGMKKQKEHYTQLHQDLRPGVRVEFSNGLYGTVEKVGRETVDIKVKSGAVVEVSRYAVSRILTPDSQSK